MIGLFRRFLGTRAARLFFVVLIIPFVMWGVADVARNFGGGNALATVGGRRIDPADFQLAFRQQMAQVTRMLGNKEPTPAVRQAVAAQTLDGLVTQAALADEVQRLGLAVPDDALRTAIFAMPAFRGTAGTFSKPQFDAVLRQNNLTEARFLDLMRGDLAQHQVLDAVAAGTQAPTVLVDQVFAFQHEARTLETVELPLAAAPDPPAPTADDLHRFYDEDTGRYSAPAYRHVKLLVLSPETVARSLTVSDADAAAWYDAHKAEFGAPEKRGLQVVVASDEAVARRLAAQWAAGADWAAMQKAAADAGASSAALDDATRADLPGTELADAAFAATPGTVTGPVQSPFGFQVLKVLNVTPGDEKPLAAVQDEVKRRIARDRAADDLPARSNRVDDVLAAGNGFDQIPDDLGATVLGGTMDAQGNTRDGAPAPIPGTPALRQAILAAAFAAPLDGAPQLVEGPDQSYYALTVDSETKPEAKPFAAVEDQVREDWLHDARRRSQEVVAAKLLAAVKSGTSLDDAATVAGVRTDRTPPLARGVPTPGVPQPLSDAAFTLAPHGATMVETPDGFVVAQLAAADAPAPSTDPVGVQQLHTALDTALGQDLNAVYAAALRTRAKPTVNRAMLQELTQ